MARPIRNDDDETAEIVISLIAGLAHDEIGLMWARLDEAGPTAAVFVRRPHVHGCMTAEQLTAWLRDCADDIESTTRRIAELGRAIDDITRPQPPV